jgi:hypothetical protein
VSFPFPYLVRMYSTIAADSARRTGPSWMTGAASVGCLSCS